MTEPASVPTPEQAARIAAALGDGERLLWSARPRASDEVRLDPRIWALPLVWMSFSVLVSLIGSASFAHDHGTAALNDWRNGIPAPWTMMPFVLIGLWLLGMPWVARRRAGHAVYALSDCRLMRFDAAASPSRSIAIGDLGPIESDEGADGYGALHVHLRAAATGRGHSIVYWRLRGLPEVAAVRRAIAAHIQPR